MTEQFIKEVIQLWMEEHQQHGTIVIEKKTAHGTSTSADGQGKWSIDIINQ